MVAVPWTNAVPGAKWQNIRTSSLRMAGSGRRRVSIYEPAVALSRVVPLAAKGLRFAATRFEYTTASRR